MNGSGRGIDEGAPLNTLSVDVVQTGVEDGSVTYRELMASYLKRVEQRESAVRAWAYIDAEAAMTEATRSDTLVSRRPLQGIPIGVKDILDTADMPTTWGTGYLRTERSPWDAAAVTLLRRAGAIVLGKTVSTELAYLTPPKTANPYDLTRTPGGSSSGSAAAVADYMVPIALGSQTAGSVTRPASYCGVIGFKPTIGSVPVAGIKPFSPSLDTLGWFTRNASDAALIYDVLRRQRPGPLQEPALEELSFGFCLLPPTAPVEQSSARALTRMRSVLEDVGATVVDIALGPDYEGLAAVQEEIMAFEAAWSYAYEYEHFRDEMGPGLRELIERGMSYEAVEYDNALNIMRRCRAGIDNDFAKVDVFVTPSVPGEPPPIKSGTGDPIHNRAWTLLGLPTVNVPVGKGVSGLPVGVQLVGRRGMDRWLLGLTQSLVAHVRDPG